MVSKKLRDAVLMSNKRLDKLTARYKNELACLWVENARGELVHALNKAFTLTKAGWVFREFASESYTDFYAIGRGETRLVELWGEFVPRRVKHVDATGIKKLEAEIAAEFDVREKLSAQFEA